MFVIVRQAREGTAFENVFSSEGIASVEALRDGRFEGLTFWKQGFSDMSFVYTPTMLLAERYPRNTSPEQ